MPGVGPTKARGNPWLAQACGFKWALRRIVSALLAMMTVKHFGLIFSEARTSTILVHEATSIIICGTEVRLR